MRFIFRALVILLVFSSSSGLAHDSASAKWANNQILFGDIAPVTPNNFADQVWSIDLMNGDDRLMFDLLEGFYEEVHWEGSDRITTRAFGNETGRFKILCAQVFHGNLEGDSFCTIYVVDKKVEGEKDLATSFNGPDATVVYKDQDKALQWLINMMGEEIHSFEIIRHKYRFETACSAVSRECTWKIRFNEE